MKAEDLFLAALEKPSAGERAAYLDEMCGPDCRLAGSGRGPAAFPRARGQLPAGLALRSRRHAGRRRPARADRLPDRPVQAAAADRRGRHGRRLHGRADRSRSGARSRSRSSSRAWTRRQVHRPLRGRAAGPGADGPSQHRQGPRRRGDGVRPALLRHGAGQGRADHRVLRRATSSRPRERLELFVPVCQAVQHAHQKGIIHRDLKPSNVLVALYDGKPVPKVIDFGVAKATGQKLTEQTLFTGFGTDRRHAGVHEPRAGGARAASTSTPAATSIRWACCCTSC